MWTPVVQRCMVVAPVGFQCRECVAQAAAQTQQTSGRAVPRPWRSAATSDRDVRPRGICAVAFLLSLGVGVESVVGNYGMGQSSSRSMGSGTDC